MTSPSTEETQDYGETIVEISRDRKTIVLNLAGKEYTATKPRKSDEWFAELQMAISSEDSGAALIRVDQFLAKIIGEEYADIKKRRLEDDDDLGWSDLTQALYDVMEVWTTEADQPVRPTGPRSVSGTSRKRTTRK